MGNLRRFVWLGPTVMWQRYGEEGMDCHMNVLFEKTLFYLLTALFTGLPHCSSSLLSPLPRQKETGTGHSKSTYTKERDGYNWPPFYGSSGRMRNWERKGDPIGRIASEEWEGIRKREGKYRISDLDLAWFVRNIRVCLCLNFSFFFFFCGLVFRAIDPCKSASISLSFSLQSLISPSLSLSLSFLIFSLLLYAEWATSAFWVNVWKCINEQRVEPVRSKREKNGLHNFELGLGLVAEYAGVCVSSYVNQKKRHEQVQAILFCRHVDIFECVRFHMRRCEGYMDIYPRTGIQLMAGQVYM